MPIGDVRNIIHLSNRKQNIPRIVSDGKIFENFRQIIYILGDLFSGSFGPMGLDKLLFDHFNDYMVVSNDGSTILTDLEDLIRVDYAYSIIYWGKKLKREQRDGVKTFYIILSELLRKIEDLEKNGIKRAEILKALFHIRTMWKVFASVFTPNKKINADIWAKLTNTGRMHSDPESPENGLSGEFIESYLFSLLRGKLSDKNTRHLARILLEIALKSRENLLTPWFKISDYFHTVKIPGTSIKQTRLINGIVISKNPTNFSIIPPEGLKNARIMLIKQKLYIDLPDGGSFGPQGPEFRIELDGPDGYAKMNKFSRDYAIELFEKINIHKPDIIITEAGVSKKLEGIFDKNKIILIRRAKPKEFLLLSEILGIPPVDNIDNIGEEHIGIVDLFKPITIGKDKKILIETSFNKDSPEKARNFGGTILIGGAISHACDAAERLLRKGLRQLIIFLKSGSYFLGGGNTELRFMHFLNTLVNFREQSNLKDILSDNKEFWRNIMNLRRDFERYPKLIYIFEILAKTFECIPRILVENAGDDIFTVIPALKKEISIKSLFELKNCKIGYNCVSKTITDMEKDKVFESVETRFRSVDYALEIATLLTRIDKTFSIRRRVHGDEHHDEEE